MLQSEQPLPLVLQLRQADRLPCPDLPASSYLPRVIGIFLAVLDPSQSGGSKVLCRYQSDPYYEFWLSELTLQTFVASLGTFRPGAVQPHHHVRLIRSCPEPPLSLPRFTVGQRRPQIAQSGRIQFISNSLALAHPFAFAAQPTRTSPFLVDLYLQPVPSSTRKSTPPQL